MLLLRTDKLPESNEWLYELKHDGYKGIAYKTSGKLYLRSRNDNDFNLRYPTIAKALSALPNETVVDGEIVAFDASGKPSFNTLQNRGSSGGPLVYLIFDLMILAGRDVSKLPLETRQELLRAKVLPKLSEPVRYPGALNASLPDLIKFVKASGGEGLVIVFWRSMEQAARGDAMCLNEGESFSYVLPDSGMCYVSSRACLE